MIQITATPKAKIFVKDSSIEVQSIVGVLAFTSGELGKIRAGIVTSENVDGAKAKKYLHVDLKATVKVPVEGGKEGETKDQEQLVILHEKTFETKGNIPSLTMAQNAWKAILEEYGYTVATV